MVVEKNKNLPFHKILNPWIITTPPGYSTLFVPPLNNSDDRFSIIAGIVDTDTFKNEINFPIVIHPLLLNPFPLSLAELLLYAP